MFFSLSSTIRTRSPGMVGLLHRQCEHEAAAVARLTLDPDPAAVQFDESFREREPEASALALLRADVGLLELLEDPLPVFGRNARASVGHRHLHLTVDLRRGYHDAASLRRELHRVREQVEDDLAQPPLVAFDQVDARRLLEREPYAVLRRRLAHHHDAALERLTQRKRGDLELDLPGLDL